MTTRITTALAAALLLGGASLAAAQTSSGSAPATGAGANSPSNVTAQPNAPTAQQDQQGRPAEAPRSGPRGHQSGDGQNPPGGKCLPEAQAKSRNEAKG